MRYYVITALLGFTAVALFDFAPSLLLELAIGGVIPASRSANAITKLWIALILSSLVQAAFAECGRWLAAKIALRGRKGMGIYSTFGLACALSAGLFAALLWASLDMPAGTAFPLADWLIFLLAQLSYSALVLLAVINRRLAYLLPITILFHMGVKLLAYANGYNANAMPLPLCRALCLVFALCAAALALYAAIEALRHSKNDAGSSSAKNPSR